MLPGGSKDVLNEIERNLHDAMNVSSVDTACSSRDHKLTLN